jgi:hypothetical protein
MRTITRQFEGQKFTRPFAAHASTQVENRPLPTVGIEHARPLRRVTQETSGIELQRAPHIYAQDQANKLAWPRARRQQSGLGNEADRGLRQVVDDMNHTGRRLEGALVLEKVDCLFLQRDTLPLVTQRLCLCQELIVQI